MAIPAARDADRSGRLSSIVHDVRAGLRCVTVPTGAAAGVRRFARLQPSIEPLFGAR
ncbi:hypothetical protein ACF3M1_04670 [Luteimonas sp. WGS1318]|uniref:hypothetical protein n=1 Tax=Luteimonas sp. WGS1318 TaxID=3366815 RepID=UPI00372D2379